MYLLYIMACAFFCWQYFKLFNTIEIRCNIYKYWYDRFLLVRKQWMFGAVTDISDAIQPWRDCSSFYNSWYGILTIALKVVICHSVKYRVTSLWLKNPLTCNQILLATQFLFFIETDVIPGSIFKKINEN